MSISSLSPSRTIVTNFSSTLSTSTTSGCSEVRDIYEDGVWVLDSCCGSSWIGCGLSNGTVQIYDQERLQQLQSYTLTHGDNQLSDLTSDSFDKLATSSMNGSICLFDIRQPLGVLRFQIPKKEQALSVTLGYGGELAAVGSSRSQIHFFDIRSGGKLLGSYVDAHTDEVTRVRFQPSSADSTTQSMSSTTSLLVSASEDGLACIFDTSQPSEEAALQAVLNVQTPLRRVGFFGPAFEGVYCLTGSETFSVWHHETAQRICDFGLTLRSDLSALADLQVDYLVDCYWKSSNQQLLLLAGGHDGNGIMFQVEAGKITPLYRLQNGHKGDIRSWSHAYHCDSFFTVGEDARVCEWNQGSETTQSPSRFSKGVSSKLTKNRRKGKSDPY